MQPTITIAIPARNESDELKDTLKRLLALDYPKVEIIVLDDSSQDNTSQTIKDFAHKGVRFIAGRKMPQGWRGKNYAHKQLLSQASGELVLFIDADDVITDAILDELVNQQDCLIIEDDVSYSNPYQKAFLEPWIFYIFNKKLLKSTGWMVNNKKLSDYISNNLNGVKQDMLLEESVSRKLSGNSVITSSSEGALPKRNQFKLGRNRQYFIRHLYKLLNSSLLASIGLGSVLIFFSIGSFYNLLRLSVAGVIGFILLSGTLTALHYIKVPNLYPNKLLSFACRLVSVPFMLFGAGWLLIESGVRYKLNKVYWRGRNIS